MSQRVATWARVVSGSRISSFCVMLANCLRCALLWTGFAKLQKRFSLPLA